MKFMHLSDLHIGKRVNEFSMIEDQKHILNEILEMIKEEKPDGLIIAGDVYDKSIPTVEGVTLFDGFLTSVSALKTPVYIVSGNHDSAERLNFGGRIMEAQKVYIAGVFEGELKKVTVTDEHGPLNIYLLPFVKPAMVTPYHPEIETYEEAVKAIIEHANVDTSERNLLVAHQFIICGNQTPIRSDSELESIGGLDQIDASVFEPFDYVALGHLHGAQKIGRESIRYAGSPIKYSFSEVRQKKSVTMVTMGKKGEVSYELKPLTPLKDMRVIKGPIEELLNPEYYTQANTNDYIQATLTDEENIVDAIGRLRTVYPNIMRLDFENSMTKNNENARTMATDVQKKNPMELFKEFFTAQNNVDMNEKQEEIMTRLLNRLEGEE
ncbi:MAG: exonuclease SbcCD subunit D [bacterium]|nr:exonuclease SbcCD subunit D [bacterium]